MKKILKRKFLIHHWSGNLLNEFSSSSYSPLRANSRQTTDDLISTCPQTENNDYQANLGVTSSQHVRTPAAVGPLDRYYRHRSVSTQIAHDAGLALIPYTGQNSSPLGIEPAPHSVVRVLSTKF